MILNNTDSDNIKQLAKLNTGSNYIDVKNIPIFVINLDTDTKRWEYIKYQLDYVKNNKYERVSAVDMRKPDMSNLYKDNRIILHSRKNIHTILKENRSACFITHQWNNDFNYMTLELMYCNYPVLHNSEGWNNFGYHYDINKWNEAINTLHNALTTHKYNLNKYKSHAANLVWKHSIYNPEIQSEWLSII
jgi:hypothetical protein